MAGNSASRKWHFITAFCALLGLAPWVIYLGGLAKLTDVLLDGKYSLNQALRQPIIMLEWYTVSAQLVNIVLIAVLGFASALRRSNAFLIGFIMCNSAIVIIRATERIQQINLIKDGASSGPVIGATTYTGNAISFLRAEVVGQIVTCAWNFFLAILLGVAGGEHLPGRDAAAKPPVAA